jgi:hypothetical protein
MTKDRRLWLALAFAVIGLLALMTGVIAGLLLTAAGEHLPPILTGVLAGTAFGWAMGGMMLGYLLRAHRLGRAALAVSAFVFFFAFPVMNSLLQWNISAQMRRFAAGFGQ